MRARNTIKPKTDSDLDDYANYLAREANADIALKFLTAANETFALLANHPNIGWPSSQKLAILKPLRVFSVKGFKMMLILYRPLLDGADIPRVVHGSRNLQKLFRRRGGLDGGII